MVGHRSSDDYHSWSGLSLEELEQVYWDKVAPRLRDLDIDPHEVPRYQDLVNAGVSGFARPFAKGAHAGDWTTRQFLAEYVGLDDGSRDDNPWGLDDETTRGHLDDYLQHQRRRRELADTTVASLRSRLARWVQTYKDLHGEANVVERAQDPDLETVEFDRNLQVFDRLDEELGSDETKLAYLSAVDGFYSRLERRSIAAFNPVGDFDREYPWERPDQRDNPSLDASDVQTLYATAEGLEEQLLVVATAGWGLRRSEVAQLHVGQLVLDDGHPRVVFDDDRKSGPATIALVYGVGVLEARIDELADRSGWSGHLFPSPEHRGPVAADTVTRRFRELADRSDVQVYTDDGPGVATPHMARRYWYQAYQDAIDETMDRLKDVAEAQGASSVDVVWNNYLDEEQRREHRREAMREQLADAFEGAI